MGIISEVFRSILGLDDKKQEKRIYTKEQEEILKNLTNFKPGVTPYRTSGAFKMPDVPDKTEDDMQPETDQYTLKQYPEEPSEWAKAAIEGINELAPNPNIRFSTVNRPNFDKWQEDAEKPKFSHLLRGHLLRSGISNPDFYKAAYIDRKLFSAMINNPNYQPSKETAAACCFGLKLSLEESKELLKAAGYSLSMSIQWDRAVYYCLKEGIYDLDDVNELLYYLDEKCIGVRY